jgi:hypothetical protein
MGSTTILGRKKNANAWGSGLPVLVGAGDGLEIESESLALDAQLIENTAVSGQGTQLPGALGNKLAAGDVVCPLYYRGPDLDLALAFGTLVAAVQQGGSAAYLHGLRLAASHVGLEETIAIGGALHPCMREFPHAKVNGFTLAVEAGQIAKLTLATIPFNLHLCGADDPDRIVVPVLPAAGALTIAAQPEYSGPVTVLLTDADSSITELVCTFIGLDEDGEFATEVYTLSTCTKTWTGTVRFSTISSATVSGITGAPGAGDLIQVGVKNVNTTTTYTSISLPSTADYQPVTFAHMRVYINDQSGADFVAGDEHFISKLQLKMEPGFKADKITTRFGNKADEPTKDAFSKVTASISFPQWDSANIALLKARLLAGKKKMKVIFTGPEAAAGYALSYIFYLNNVQFSSGSPNVGGPSQIPFDLEGVAHRATASPTGLPAWADTQPISAAVVNLRSTAIWT